jgi:2-polyprenyl-6-methoxyphenol hydroxylase-like FAD-dependent oxidoreductase
VTDIAIIGGGIGGLTTAIALKQFGFNCEVFEQAPALLDVGAAIALWPNATRVLTKLNLLDQVSEKAGVMREIHWLHRDGSLINRVRLSCFDIEATPAIALHRADLQSILLHALPADSIKLGNDFVDQQLEDKRIRARFAGENSVLCDFLIGADGIHSKVRKKITDEATPVYRGYLVWRGIAPVFPRQLEPNTACEIHDRGKRFGIGPVGHSRVGWWAAANTEPGTHVVTKGKEATAHHATQRELLDLFAGWYPPVVELIETTPPSSILRTEACDLPAQQPWGLGQVTLLGDAIHPTTPNLGQGGCMAIEDALVLARCFEKYGPSATALRTYEQVRYARTSGVTEYSRLYGAVGQLKGAFAVRVRNRVMSLLPETLVHRAMRIVFDYDASTVRI